MSLKQPTFVEIVTTGLACAALMVSIKACNETQRQADFAEASLNLAKSEADDNAKTAEKALELAGNSAAAADRSAKAAERQVGILGGTLEVSGEALRQGARFNAAQLRPVLAFDWASKRFSEPRLVDDQVRWNWAYINRGQSPAYDVTFYEGISLNGSPFQEVRRIGAAELGAGEGAWSTATFSPSKAIGKLTQSPYYTLRVRFHFKDALGNWSWTQQCTSFALGNPSFNCAADYNPATGRATRNAPRFPPAAR